MKLLTDEYHFNDKYKRPWAVRITYDNNEPLKAELFSHGEHGYLSTVSETTNKSAIEQLIQIFDTEPDVRDYTNLMYLMGFTGDGNEQ